jgi:flavoprotein
MLNYQRVRLVGDDEFRFPSLDCSHEHEQCRHLETAIHKCPKSSESVAKRQSWLLSCPHMTHISQ